MNCPECGTEMRQTRRGATLKKRGPAFICPVNESEVAQDDHGHLRRKPDSLHAYLRVWEPREAPAPPTRPSSPSLDDPESFRRWLQAMPPDRVVGYAGDSCACPLHSWLMAQGARIATVDQFGYAVDGQDGWAPIPAWAAAFVRQIDRPFRNQRRGSLSVTARECLEALAYVEERLGGLPV